MKDFIVRKDDRTLAISQDKPLAVIRHDGKVLIDWLRVEQSAEAGDFNSKLLLAVRDQIWERM